MAFDTGSLGDLIVRITADARELEKALNKADKSVKDGASKMNVTLRGLASASLTIGTAVAGFFALAIKTTVEYGDELLEVSKRTGVAVERLSTLKFVAEQTESSFQSLATGLKFLNRNIFESNQGNAEAVELFVKLGLATRTASGEAVKAEDLFEQIADRFSVLTDESEKTALAMKLFGRSGTDLIPVLDLGSKGIRELEETARKLGLELSADNAKDIDTFSDKIKELQAAGGGLALQLSKNVIPIITSLTQHLIDAVKQMDPYLQKINVILEKTQSVGERIGQSFNSGDPVLDNARAELVASQERLDQLQFGSKGSTDDANKISDELVNQERLNALIQERMDLKRVEFEEEQTANVTREENVQRIEVEADQWQRVIDKLRELDAVRNSLDVRVKAFAQELIALGDAISSSFTRALSGLISGSLSGQEAIKQLGASLVQVIADFIAKQIIAMTIGKALQAAAVALGIASAAALGAAWAPVAAFVSLATFGANAAPAAAGITSTATLAATLARAIGAGIPALAEGGIVSRPTLALIGEAGPEAVVPLSKFGGQGGVTIDRIEVNISGNADRNTVDYMVEQLGKRFEQESRSV